MYKKQIIECSDCGQEFERISRAMIHRKIRCEDCKTKRTREVNREYARRKVAKNERY